MADYTFAFQTSTTHAGFLKCPSLDAFPDAPYVIAGIPWDGCVTNRPGTRFGPYEIRRSSHMLCDGTHTLWPVTPLGHIADAGDLTLPNTALERMREALMPQAHALLAKHHMVWLGGDHSITLPLLRAYRAHHGRPLAIVHFDAHCDTWTDHFGEPSGHGTWVHEAISEGLIDPALTVQLGIRSSAERDTAEYVKDRGGLIYTARDLRGLINRQQLAAVIDEVKTRLQDQPVYLTLDIDCLDPAYAPGTGTPEPGGLTSAQVLTLLEEWVDLNWIGMDLSEVSPPYDHAQLTSNAAAHFVWTYLAGRVRG